LIAFYIALATALILKGAVIAQALYDLAQKLSHMKYGWLIIIGFMSASSYSPPTFNVTLHYPCHHPVDDLTPWF